MTATTSAVYGPPNPFDDKQVADAFWELKGDLMSILVGFLSFITPHKPITAHTKATRRFEVYYKAGGMRHMSPESVTR